MEKLQLNNKGWLIIDLLIGNSIFILTILSIMPILLLINKNTFKFEKYLNQLLEAKSAVNLATHKNSQLHSNILINIADEKLNVLKYIDKDKVILEVYIAK